MSKMLETVHTLPIESCRPVEWNPNEQDLATFNELVESIEVDGFLEPITVVQVEDTDAYDIIAGEHRWKAAKLAGLTEITAIVKEWTLDEAQINNVRMNAIKGKLNPEKFAEVWSRLAKKYDRDELAKRMGFGHKEKELDRLIGATKKTLPRDLHDEFDKRADSIRNVEDLAAVVQSLYAQYGATLNQSFMVLTFGGRVHLMIKMTDKTRKKLIAKMEQLAGEDRDANEVIEAALDDIE